MSWKETCVMEERMRFISDWLKEEFSMAQLCRDYGISRKTGYKWVARYGDYGMGGLEDRPRAHRGHPFCVAPKIEQAIVDARDAYPHWGPRKLAVWLRRHEPDRPWPCTSTIGDIIQRNGRIVPRKTRRRCAPNSQPMAACKGANDLWCADFKGWFRTQDGRPCHPLTITDGHSRFILRCQGMSPKTDFEAVKPLFEATFRAFGLPAAIRTDNGPPFATTGLFGLSRLSVWWILLGIRPDRIRPGKPQDNGRHERMHRTLKAETANPPQQNRRAQQKKFDRFQHEFNNERPHEALGQQTPASHYQASPVPFPNRLPQCPDYPDDWQTRKVRGGGDMKWGGRDVYVTQALAGQPIGLKPVGDGAWEVYFTDLLVALFDEKALRIKRLDPRKKK